MRFLHDNCDPILCFDGCMPLFVDVYGAASTRLEEESIRTFGLKFFLAILIGYL